jgi:CpeS-like protein
LSDGQTKCDTQRDSNAWFSEFLATIDLEMNIREFFELSVGKWVSQRTSHQLAVQKQGQGKLTIFMEALAVDAPTVTQLCEQCEVDPARVVCALQVNWEGTTEWSDKQQTASTVMVAVSEPNQDQSGTLLRRILDHQQQLVPAVGQFSIGEGDELILTTEHAAYYAQERIWFESPNFRLRQSILRDETGLNLASFCSEIRMGGGSQVPKPAADATENEAS